MASTTSSHFNAFKTLAVLLCCLLIVGASVAQDLPCVQKGACTCERDGQKIDLTSISPSNGDVAFSAKDKQNPAYSYLWNPCYALTKCGDDPSAAVCQVQSGGLLRYNAAGYVSTAQFQLLDDKTTIALVYPAQMGTNSRHSQVKLVCDTTGTAANTFESDGEDPATFYKFTFTSKLACFPDGPSSSGWSVGDTLLLIFFLSLILYVVAGILFNMFYRKQSGKDIVPNLTFWVAMPGLMKEGGVFIVGKVRGEKSGYSGV